MTATLVRTSTDDDAADRVTEPRRRTDRPVRASGVLRSEWVKLRSVRSSLLTVLAAAGTMLAVGALAAAFDGGLLAEPPGDGGGPGDGPGGGDATSTVLAGTLLAPLVVGVLGVLVVTSEYATGTMRSTLTFVPGRLAVLWSKVAVLTAVVLPVMLVATVGTFFAGMGLIGAGDAGVRTAALSDPGVLRAVLGTAGYLTLVALIGVALGVLLRATPAALSALFALVFLVPGLGMLLPAAVRDDVLVYLPSNAASSVTTVTPDPSLLSPTAGGLVLLAWVAVLLLMAAVALRRRSV